LPQAQKSKDPRPPPKGRGGGHVRRFGFWGARGKEKRKGPIRIV